jgi:uncharacterized protein YigA (DUF484 family)
MQPNEILVWLRDNPAFFETYAADIAEIYVPDSHGGRAISLTERQLVTLREKNRALEIRLAELLRFGEENDITSDKLHALTVDLVRANDLDAITDALRHHIKQSFGIDQVAMRLWPIGAANLRDYNVQISDDVVRLAQNLVSPYCGPYVTDEVMGWFGSEAQGLKSFAQFALRAGEDPFGLLVLASTDTERFYPDMGTLYLQRLSELVSAAILRVLPVPPVITEELVVEAPAE